MRRIRNESDLWVFYTGISMCAVGVIGDLTIFVLWMIGTFR